MTQSYNDFEIVGSGVSAADIEELFPLALRKMLVQLHTVFEPERQRLLTLRQEMQRRYDAGELPQYISDHPGHQPGWKVAPIPSDLLDRRVEITGPISSKKMVINMLSANQDGEVASTAMLDFEDSMCPTWANVVSGIRNLIGVSHKDLFFTQPATNSAPEKIYRLDSMKMAIPMVRIRGLHMNEGHVLVGGVPISAGLFDLTCSAYHTAKTFLRNQTTPKFYVPKTEHFLEACWWNTIFTAVEEYLAIPRDSLRVTFLIETLPAAYQMEEILFEIRGRACGLNGGRWDKIFSDIKTLRSHPQFVLANRASIDMARPWMDNYAKRLVKICHEHGAFAMGGMSAFTPGKDPQTREAQTEKVRADKAREASIGHDGCWVSHPYFIGIARSQFAKINQLDVLLPDFPKQPNLLPDPSGPKTLDGLRTNLRVGIAYQQGWNDGQGCIAFENLMEDLATLEISRAQTWQWRHHRIHLDDGTPVTDSLIEKVLEEELQHIYRELNITDAAKRSQYLEAKQQVQKLFLADQLAPFFTTQGDNNHATF